VFVSLSTSWKGNLYNRWWRNLGRKSLSGNQMCYCYDGVRKKNMNMSFQFTMIVRLHLFVITSACWRKSVLVSMSRTHSMPPHFKKCTFNNNNIAQIIIIKKLNYITVAILPILESSCLYIFFHNKILLVEKHKW